MFRVQRRHVRRGAGTLALAFACLFAGRSFAQQPQTNADLAAVFKDWQSRQGVVKSARYVVTGTTEFKLDPLLSGSPIRPRRFVLLLDLEKKRYRLEQTQEAIQNFGTEGHKRSEYRPHMNTSAFDGKMLQSLRHKKANRIDDDLYDLSIGKGNLGPNASLPDEVWPIFFAHGIVPTVHSPLLVDKWPLTHDPKDFDRTCRQMFRERNCLLVRTDPLGGTGSISDEFWIDPGQQSAILRYVYFTGTEPWARHDIFWKETPHGRWVDRWTKTQMKGVCVDRIIRFRVESFEANPEVAAGDFTLPAEPGMKVAVGEYPPGDKGQDPSKALIETYLISPSGSWDKIPTTGYTTVGGIKLTPEDRRRWISWILGGGVTVGAVLFYLSRRRGKRVPS